MPTYEYICEKCGYQFEKFQSITARSLRKCPQCKEQGLKRLIGTGAGVIFKGSGFYQTDYRSESYKKAQQQETKADTKTDTKSEKKDTKKTDSKSTDKPKSVSKENKKTA